MQCRVYTIAAPLFGDFVRGAFRGKVRGEGFGIGDAGEVGAFENILVVGFGGEEEGGGFGGDDGYKAFISSFEVDTGDIEDILPPSGSSGLILGDIFGLKAGLTCTEP